MARFINYITCFILLCSQLSAQRLSFKHYTSDNGLSQTETSGSMVLYDSTIYVLEVSHQIKKFDGYRFQHYENSFVKSCCIHGFVNFDNYSIIMEDANIVVYRNGIFKNIKTQNDSIVLPPQKGIFIASDTIWVTTIDGLFYVDVPSLSLIRKNPNLELTKALTSGELSSYIESKDKKIKLLYKANEIIIKNDLDSLISLDPLKIQGTWKNYFKKEPFDLRLYSARFPKFRTFYGQTNVLHINQGNNSPLLAEFYEDSMEIKGVLGSREGNVTKISDQCYLDGGHEGIFRINPNIHFFPSGGQMVPALHSIITDHSKNILFGSYGYGYSHFQNYELNKDGIFPDSKVMPGALSHSNGKMYTFEDAPIAGLFEMQFNLQNRLIKKRVLDQTGFILKELKDHSMVGGSVNNKLFIFKPESLDKNYEVKIIDASKGITMSNILGIEEDNIGRIWMTGQGIAIYDIIKDTAITYKKPKEDEKHFGGISIKMDHMGTMWFGTTKGVFYLKNASNYKPEDLNIFDKCTKLALPNGEQTTITFATQLDSFIVMGSFTSVNFIDLNSFYKNPKNPIIYQLIYGEDLEGGGSEQNAVLVDKERRLWIGSQAGATMIDWDHFRFDQTKSKIAIHFLVVGNDTIDVKNGLQKINVPYDKRNISISFGLDKNISLLKNVFFDYFIVKNGKDTIISKMFDQDGILTLDYLPPGKYTFSIVAKKHGQKMDEINLNIHAPLALSENIWFWMGLTISLLTLFTGLIIYRNNLKNEKLSKSLLLSQLNAEKDQMHVQSIVSSFNPHFINNSLHWIQSKHVNDQDTVKLVGNLSENIRHIFECTTLGKAAHTLKEELKLVDNYVAVQMVRFNRSFQYLPPNKEDVMRHQHSLVLLMQIQIHVENAIEHGLRNRLKSTYVKVDISENLDFICLTIEDDGVGRRKAKAIGSLGTQQGTKMLEELHKIFNQNNSRNIEQNYEDDIFESNAEKFGTRITISIPKNYEFLLKAT